MWYGISPEDDQIMMIETLDYLFRTNYSKEIFTLPQTSPNSSSIYVYVILTGNLILVSIILSELRYFKQLCEIGP